MTPPGRPGPGSGRSHLVDQVRQSLETERGIVLWGPAGVGKTWLATQAAPDAVVIDIAQLSDPEALGERLADTTSGPLILDGLDPWIDDPALQGALQGWVDQGWGPLVVTHRRRWTPSWAQAVEVPPLGEDDAMRLFLDEIERLHSPSHPDPEAQAALRGVLPVLDGIPRALLWAASSWGLLGTEGLVARLGEPLPDTLTAPLPPLVASLSDVHRDQLQALATFVGPFAPRDAVAVVGPDVVDAFQPLHDATLLHRLAPGIFRVPHAVRQVVVASGVADALAERHAAWCLRRHADPDLRVAGAQDVPDLVAAARWLVEQRDARVGSLLVVLAAIDPGQPLDLIEAARARAPSPSVFRALCRVLRLRGRLVEAAAALEEGLALAGDDPEQAGPLWRHWGVLHHAQGDWERGRIGYERALACAKEAGAPQRVAIATANLGAVDHDLCNYEDADQRYAEALIGLRGHSDPQLELTVQANRAVLLQEVGKLEAAEAAYRRALVLLGRANHPHMMAITQGNLGLLLHELGRLDEAGEALDEAIERLAPFGDPKTEALCLARLAAVRADQGRSDDAERAWEAASWAAQQADPVTQQVVDLFGGFVDLAHDREATLRSRLDGAEAVLRGSGDARIAARMLRQRVEAAPAVLRVDDSGFIPPGEAERVDLSRHASVRRMFLALVDTARGVREALDVPDLFAAGWPDDQISPESMRNRVHVNLAKLRRWGLKPLIERSNEGYRLVATVEIVAR